MQFNPNEPEKETNKTSSAFTSKKPTTTQQSVNSDVDSSNNQSTPFFTFAQFGPIFKQRSFLVLSACVLGILYLLLLDRIFSSFRVGGFIQFIGNLSESTIAPHKYLVIVAVILNGAAWYTKSKKIVLVSLAVYVVGALFFTKSIIYLSPSIIIMLLSLLVPVKKT